MFILVLYIGLIVLTGYLFSITPKGFIPKQDNDYLQISAQLPEGYALERTDEVMKKMQKILAGTEGIREFMCVVGLNGATRTRTSNSGALFVRMTPKAERMKQELDVNKMMKVLSKKVAEALPSPRRSY